MIARADPVLRFLRDQKLLLASRSVRRQELFTQIGLSPELISTSIQEIPQAAETPRQFVLRMAHAKVEAACDLSGPDYFTIGADTIIELDGQIVGKPRDRETALATLFSLSNRSHTVLTAVYASQAGKKAFHFATETRVLFGSFSEASAQDYLDSDLPFDRAGAYGIQDYFGCFHIKGIEGDYNNVLGFPLYDFYEHMLCYIAENR